jgi:hypothetical protein
MAISVNPNVDSVNIELSGMTALLALIRDVEIPYHRIESVSVGPATRLPWYAMRVGYSNPISGARGGRFWVGGRRIIASYGDPARVLTIDLKPGAREAKLPDSVQVAVDDPQRIADEIQRHLNP